MHKKRKWLNSFTIALFLTLVSLFIYRLDPQLLHLWELKSYDMKVRARGVRPVTGEVVIVAIDENSLAREGRWPWPRTKIARLVDRLSEAGVAVIGFDIFFPEKDVYVPFGAVKQSIREKNLARLNKKTLIEWLEETSDSDKQLAQSFQRSQRTVLGYSVSPAVAASLGKLDIERIKPLKPAQYTAVQRFDSPDNPVPMRQISAMQMSLPELTKAAVSSGYVTSFPDVDGVIRWVPMAMEHGMDLFAPLGLEILHQATQMSLGIRVNPYGVAGVLLGDAFIPTSENGDYLVNFYGPGETFTHYSATDILSGAIGAGELQHKIVLVGGTAAGTYDIKNSPYGPVYPGVEVHATLMENILQGDYLIRPDWLRVLDVAMILVSGLLLGLVSLYFKAVAKAGVLIFGVGGYIFLDQYLFNRMGLWVNSVYPVFTQIFVYTGVTLLDNINMLYELKDQNVKLDLTVKERTKELKATLDGLEKDLNIAHEMQIGIVPRKERIAFLSEISSLGISSVFEPSNKLGGDFWDIMELHEEKIGILMVDFAGHGIAPSLNTFRIKEFIHNLADEAESPTMLMEKLNKNISKNYDMFATCFYAVYNKRGKTMTYCRAGHPYGIWYKKSEDRLIELNVKGMALGFTDDSAYEENKIVLGPGDKVIFYTDGITEAQNSTNEFFGGERLNHAILKNKERSHSELSRAIMKCLKDFAGEVEIDDDVTLVIIEHADMTQRDLTKEIDEVDKRR